MSADSYAAEQIDYDYACRRNRDWHKLTMNEKEYVGHEVYRMMHRKRSPIDNVTDAVTAAVERQLNTRRRRSHDTGAGR